MPLKRARKARQDGVETREAILAAAEQEFADKGFELASAREICRRAKANSALMNRYFGSKEALYRLAAKSPRLQTASRTRSRGVRLCASGWMICFS